MSFILILQCVRLRLHSESTAVQEDHSEAELSTTPPVAPASECAESNQNYKSTIANLQYVRRLDLLDEIATLAPCMGVVQAEPATTLGRYNSLRPRAHAPPSAPAQQSLPETVPCMHIKQNRITLIRSDGKKKGLATVVLWLAFWALAQ